MMKEAIDYIVQQGHVYKHIFFQFILGTLAFCSHGQLFREKEAKDIRKLIHLLRVVQCQLDIASVD